MAVQTQLGINPTQRKGIGFNYAPTIVNQGQPTNSQKILEELTKNKQVGSDIYKQMRDQQTQRVAQDLTGKSAFNIPTDEFGLVDQKLTDPRQAFTSMIDATSARGKLALQTEEAKRAWLDAKNFQDQSYSNLFPGGGAWTPVPGATANNPGAKAVELAMQAHKNKTPYVWGGNSLTQGVDCSGLVQQVYRQLGVQVPRSTYEQAKNGKRVPLSQLRPGDLVFYRPESRGPGHVAIYMGNGQVVHAANPNLGIIVSRLTHSNGAPLFALRPY